jgi:hypothetical protein
VPKKSLLAQRIANAYPLWTDTRTSEQSLARQFLNPIGNAMDGMYEQLQTIADNYYLTTARVSDIDVYNYVRLPQEFEFEKEDDDNTEWIFTPPPVSGVIDGLHVQVEIAENNDVESFWYTATPARLSLETTISGTCLLASGILQDSPIPRIIPSGIVDPPNHLHVTVSGGFAYIHTDESNYVSQTMVQIEGVTREGADVIEELLYVHEDTIRTRNEFQQVEDIRCYYTPHNTTATVRVETAAFNQVDYLAAFQLAKNEYKEDVVMFWGMGNGPLPGQHTLNVRKYDTDEVLNRLGGYTGRHDTVAFELLDTEGNYVAAQDLAVEPHSNRIWVVSSGTLYLFDSDLHYPDTSQMADRNYDAAAIIEPDFANIIPGETVRLYYVWKRPLSEIMKYRIWVIKPDGTKKSIVDGAEVTYVTGASSWNAGPLMINRNIEEPGEFTLTESGDHTYCLEVGYVDETTSLDKKVISVQSKQARAQFSIGDTTGDWRPIVGIDMDSEYKLWIKNENSWKYQLNIHYDNMIIDWKRKVIYFREAYDQVRIFNYVD